MVETSVSWVQLSSPDQSEHVLPVGWNPSSGQPDDNVPLGWTLAGCFFFLFFSAKNHKLMINHD